LFGGVCDVGGVGGVGVVSGVGVVGGCVVSVSVGYVVVGYC